jgi:Short C-terminal domain
MGLMKKTLDAATLGAEKAIKAGAERMKGADVSEEEAAAAAAAGVVFVGWSHESGRNALVTLYRDRIERVKERSRLSMSSAKQDTEVTPIRSVSSVQAKKDGFTFTKVTVYASGNNIEFKFRHDDAQKFKDAVMELILPASVQPVAPTPDAPAASDHAEQIKKLGDLRGAGLLTPEEFEAKKAEILDRM